MKSTKDFIDYIIVFFANDFLYLSMTGLEMYVLAANMIYDGMC